jgi:peptide/nickel transport system substrate-binding protein
MNRSRGLRPLLAATVAVLVVAGLGACSSGSKAGSSAGGSATGPTLVVEGSPETTITQSFNPFAPTAAANGMGATALVYEPLIQFDLAAPPTYYPWLATGFAWSDGGKVITFTVRQGVKWNNGTPFTAADVAFTYNMVKNNPAANIGGLKISSVVTSGNTVTLTFPTPQYANLESIANVPIVPKSVWSTVGNPVTFTDPNPVGTGPYMLGTFTPEGITLKKSPDYWQPADVKVPAVYYPVYTSNTSALSALFTGQLDWAGNFIPGMNKNFIAPDPVHHHYWMAADGTSNLIPNLTKWPTNQLAVRQAISLAIGRAQIAAEGEAGLSVPTQSASGLTQPMYNAWAGPLASMPTLSATANPTAAEQVLEKAGFTKGSNGYFEKNGQVVSLTIVGPAPYTNIAEDSSIAAQHLQAAGIDATFQGTGLGAWFTDVADGDFQLTERWSNTGVTPYNLYDGWLDSSLAAGAAASGDFERLNDPAIDADLTKLAAASTVTEQTSDLIPLEQFVASDLPIIPVATADADFEYNSAHYVGWPTAQNPYDIGQPESPQEEVVILHLRPAG